MAEPLFRFLLVRPPVAQDTNTASLDISQGSPFQHELLAALKLRAPREQILKITKDYIASSGFVGQPTKLPLQIKLRQFGTLVDAASTDNDLQHAAVTGLAQQAFGESAASLVESNDFKDLKQQLRDSVLAIKFNQGESSIHLEGLVGQLRDLELIDKAVQLGKDNPRTQTPNDTSDKPRADSEGSTEAVLTPLEEWQIQKQYSIGSQVTYAEIPYVCIQAHPSVAGWEPPKTPALWVRISRPDPEGPEPPVQSADLNLSAYRKRSLLLPTSIELDSVLRGPVDETEQPPDGSEKEAQRLINLHAGLTTAVKELVSLSPRFLKGTEQNAQDGFEADNESSGLSFLKKQLEYHSRLKDLNIDQFRAAAERAGTNPAAAADAARGGTTDPLVLQDTAGSTSAVGLTKELFSAFTAMPGLGKFDPTLVADTSPKLSSNTPLSESTSFVLNSEGIEKDKVPLTDVVTTLRSRLADTQTQLRSLSPTVEESRLTRIGQNLVSTRVPRPSVLTQLITGIDFGRLVPRLPIIPVPDPRIPHTVGKIKNLGIGDLLIVKQQLIGYEGADIAHIENVLRGESKTREHTKTDRTETTTATETENFTEDTHELSSTNRFEMAQESQKQIKEDFDVKGSVKATAKYGPAVEVSASVEGGYSRSKEESSKTATKFSQDVTEKAAKKVTERILQKSSTVNSSEIVEKNTHGVDNKSGSLNVSGVYQWVNKVYEAQVFNYGLRTLFDFMVPEPATWMIDTMTKAADDKLTLEKPTHLPLHVDQLSEHNYAYWVSKYDATDVKPYPPDYITVTDHIHKAGSGHPDFEHSAQIVIESGYEAVYASASALMVAWDTGKAVVDISLGAKVHRFSFGPKWTWSAPMNRQRSSIAWAARTFGVSHVTVTVEVKCAATEDTIAAWKADTHAKLTRAYLAKLQDYEDALATLKLQQGITIEGRNPAANLALVKQELKKNCISIITGQHFDHFNAISVGGYGHSQINLNEAEAEGEYVRFFEQAFEWDQIMYVMYPYYWGRKSQWSNRLAFEDPDPAFDEFLKAGYTRVQVPARPGFELAIDHFLQFGDIWNGGPLPAITSPLFVPIADEIAERAKKPQGEIPQGPPWKVRVPTTLVKLRQDDQLPKWKKNTEGEWVPDE